MTRLTAYTVTPKKLLNAMLRGWKRVKWTRGDYVRDSMGDKLTFSGGSFRNPYGVVAKPCSACAVGAIMVDQGSSASDIERLLLGAGRSAAWVTQCNDDSKDKRGAVKVLTEYMLGKQA